MPEDDDREQRAAKDKAEAPQKQKRVIQEYVGTSKRNRDIAQPALERDLHDAEHTDDHQISRSVFRKLFPRTEQHLAERGQCLPNEDDRSDYLDREKKQISYRFRASVARLHRANDISHFGPAFQFLQCDPRRRLRGPNRPLSIDNSATDIGSVPSRRLPGALKLALARFRRYTISEFQNLT